MTLLTIYSMACCVHYGKPYLNKLSDVFRGYHDDSERIVTKSGGDFLICFFLDDG